MIPGPPCGFVASGSSATGISPTGEICGGWFDCNGNGHGAVWLGQRGWQNIPLPPGLAWVGPAGMNSARHMAALIPGSPNPELYRAAFINFAAGTTTIIRGLPGADTSFASAINESSVVCGYSYNSATGNPPRQAFIWQNGQMSTLSLPFGSRAVANDIADNGSVCGWMGNGNYATAHGFIWNSGKTIDIGTVLPGATGVDVRGISSNGAAVCGFAAYPPQPDFYFVRKAFLWKDGVGIDLGMFPGYQRAHALAVNDSDIVIGYLDDFASTLQTTFIWQNGVMHDLNDLIPASLNIRIEIVWSINNAGQIAGYAELQDNSGDQVAVRLTPIPPVLGDYNCDYTVNVYDLLGVITHWGPAPPGSLNAAADFNHDGVVNVDDLLTVITHWS